MDETSWERCFLVLRPEGISELVKKKLIKYIIKLSDLATSQICHKKYFFYIKPACVNIVFLFFSFVYLFMAASFSFLFAGGVCDVPAAGGGSCSGKLPPPAALLYFGRGIPKVIPSSSGFSGRLMKDGSECRDHR